MEILLLPVLIVWAILRLCVHGGIFSADEDGPPPELILERAEASAMAAEDADEARYEARIAAQRARKAQEQAESDAGLG